MFRHKPLGVQKAKIEELVDQLEENNQTILLQKLQITSLREEYLTLVNMDQMQNGYYNGGPASDNEQEEE